MSCALAARELGIGANLLPRWRREAEAEAPAFVGTGTACDKELSKLKCKLARVEKERNFCGKLQCF